MTALLISVRSGVADRQEPVYGAGGGGGGGGLIGIGTVTNGKCRHIVNGGRWYCGGGA
ncbi:hypothetical protein H7H80_20080, partial [Mycobacterium interjectum]|nr:hypothetical protein [Mycobacterium interjectum]